MPVAIAGLLLALAPVATFAHAPDALAQQRLLEGGFVDVAWLGAAHMLGGYDHLLFLLGVLFFLTRPAQVVGFITVFTLGHTLVLLGATPLGVRANPYLIDALIALTVIYKAFENLGGFPRVFGRPAPPLLPMIFLFGLVHGFGLSTRLQQMALADDPALTMKILAFNVGVEFGQIVALAAMGLVLVIWRGTPVWPAVARGSNVALMGAGALLFVWQIGALLGAVPPPE